MVDLARSSGVEQPGIGTHLSLEAARGAEDHGKASWQSEERTVFPKSGPYLKPSQKTSITTFLKNATNPTFSEIGGHGVRSPLGHL